MELVLDTIETELSQVFIPSENTQVKAVRPHLYIHNGPSGTLKVQICTTDNAVIAESETISITDITSEPYYHGHVTFYVDAYLKKDGEYKFKVVSGGGYTFSESAYCGVCTDYGMVIYPSTEEVLHSSRAPLDFQVWSYK